eukprot:CAMPEP_0183822938 /NCGR_PEP_ID=MMETSP0803_2-20130417/65893_1 /TAXON_ID=195967 /ORGANISM="Crustomastix stigmata, Strain CCMP3273" /LENGTH=247 /DNA_ID=CAMNT_0026067831 /DNA_START=866 /DNA_END=1609 /DNA_ORIENTATION=-
MPHKGRFLWNYIHTHPDWFDRGYFMKATEDDLGLNKGIFKTGKGIWKNLLFIPSNHNLTSAATENYILNNLQRRQEELTQENDGTQTPSIICTVSEVSMEYVSHQHNLFLSYEGVVPGNYARSFHHHCKQISFEAGDVLATVFFFKGGTTAKALPPVYPGLPLPGFSYSVQHMCVRGIFHAYGEPVEFAYAKSVIDRSSPLPPEHKFVYAAGMLTNAASVAAKLCGQECQSRLYKEWTNSSAAIWQR